MDEETIDAMQEDEDVQGLVQVLKDANPVMRRYAAIALGEIGDPEAVEPLLEALKVSERQWRADADFAFNLDFQEMVSEAIGEIGEPAVQPLCDAIKEVDTTRALIAIGAPAIEALKRLLQDGDEIVRRSAAYVLAEIDDPGVVEALIECLNDKDAKVRLNAAEGLGRSGDERAIAPLTRALKDGDKDVREVAEESLQAIHS